MIMKVLFFASIAELTRCNEITVQNVRCIDELKVMLGNRFPGIEGLSYSIAVNKCITDNSRELIESDEVALLPPFSGG
jgi:sulfur-carrier protein